MAVGYAHIIKLGTIEDAERHPVPQYQFTYNDGRSTFGRTFDEDGLVEFLSEEVGLAPDIHNRVIDDLHQLGNTSINDLHIAENEMAALGFMQVASEV
jgi:hypothetical protein